nr:transposase [Niabella ginsenosidivorans]
MEQKLLLKKRGVIESVNDILKTVCDIEHTRHRSPIIAIINVYAGLCAYTFLDRLLTIFYSIKTLTNTLDIPIKV